MAHHFSSKHPTYKHRCPECKLSFTDITKLKKHVLNKHSEKPFQCSQCSKSFAQIVYLKSHERLHDEEKVPCAICGMELSKGSLERHQLRHNVEKPLNCEFCGDGFVAKAELRTHLMDNHREKIEVFDV